VTAAGCGRRVTLAPVEGQVLIDGRHETSDDRLDEPVTDPASCVDGDQAEKW
jgi:hypothetical protein